jgi:hypothetical protein
LQDAFFLVSVVNNFRSLRFHSGYFIVSTFKNSTVEVPSLRKRLFRKLFTVLKVGKTFKNTYRESLLFLSSRRLATSLKTATGCFLNACPWRGKKDKRKNKIANFFICLLKRRLPILQTPPIPPKASYYHFRPLQLYNIPSKRSLLENNC